MCPTEESKSFRFGTTCMTSLWPLTSSSEVMSQMQICPSWQPVMMVARSSITSRLEIQWVGALRPHRTMGNTRLFPVMFSVILKREWEQKKTVIIRHSHIVGNSQNTKMRNYKRNKPRWKQKAWNYLYYTHTHICVCLFVFFTPISSRKLIEEIKIIKNNNKKLQ